MPNTAAANLRNSGAFGSAPRRLGPGIWETRNGVRLRPAGAAYWEGKYRRGEVDTRGHITTPSIVAKPKPAGVGVAAAVKVKPPTEREILVEAHRQAEASLTPPLGAFGRDIHNIIAGAPRAAYATGLGLVKMWPEFIHHPSRKTTLEKQVIDPLAQHYKEKYGGSLGEILHNIGQEPVSSALDLWMLGSAPVSAVTKAGRYARAGGSLGERAAASRVQPAREVISGEARVPIIQSPNELAAWVQRNVVEKMSTVAQNLRDQGFHIPSRLGTDVRAAQQTYRDIHQTVRRERATKIEAMKVLKGVPKAARVRLWNELQAPGVPPAQIAEHLDLLAQKTLEEGTASARFRASTPTPAYESAVAYRDRLAGLVQRAEQRRRDELSAKAGAALRAPKERLGGTPVQAPLGRETLPPPEQAKLGEPPAPGPEKIEAPTVDPLADVHAQFEKVDQVWQSMVKKRAEHYKGMLNEKDIQDIYSKRAQFNKENSPRARAHGRRGYQQFKPKLPGDVARDRAIQDLHELAAAAGDEPWRVELRKLIAEHDRLTSEILSRESEHFDFVFGKGKPPEQVAAPPVPVEAKVQSIAKEMPAPKATEAGRPAAPTLDQLKGALAVAEDRIRRFQPRSPVRDLAKEKKEADRLMKQAEKVRKTGTAMFDPKAKQAAADLMNWRQGVLEDAGVLKPGEADARKGILMRELGLEPTGQEVFVHHGVKQQVRLSSLIRKTGLEGRAKPPPGVGKPNEMLLFQSGRVTMDPRELVRDYEHTLAYHFHNKVRAYFAKVGRPIGPDGPNKGWFVVDPDAPLRAGGFRRQFQRDLPAEQRAHAEGVSIDEAFAKQVEDYVNSYVAKAGTEEAAAIESRAAADGAQPVQISPDVFKQFVNPRMVGGQRSIAGETIASASDLVRASLIYANPGYVPANLIGNALFLTTEQGVHAPFNVARAGARMLALPAKGLTKAERAELRNMQRGEVGMGATVSVAGAGRGPIHALVQRIARAEGFVADDWMRLASWIRKARQNGVRTPRQQLDFLRRAANEDPEAEALANKIKAQMEDRMVSFDRMTPGMRDFADKWLFVWPWVYGASRYPFTLARDMPVRAGVGAALAEQKMKDKSMDIGFPVPSWLKPAFRTPAGLVLPRTVSTVSTPFDVLTTIGNALSGKDNAALADIMHPGIRIGMDVVKGENRFGQKVGALEALKQEAEGVSPLGTLVKGLVNPAGEPKIYGKSSRWDVLERRIGRGVYPFSVDERVAYKQARRTMSPRDRWQGDSVWLGRDYEAALKGATEKPAGLDERLQAAIGWQHYRAVARLNFYKKVAEDPKNPTALDKFAADLDMLVKLKRMSEQERAALWAAGWQAYQNKLTAKQVDHAISNIGRIYFYTDAFGVADKVARANQHDPPRRLALP